MTSGNIVLQLKNDINTKLVYKKMLQTNYLCDILQVLHDASTPIKQKIEVVVLLEENIVLCEGIEIEEVLSSLRACLESSRDPNLSCQLLSTITTLMIYFDVLSTEISRSFTELLSKQVTTSLDSTESLCVKSCCCQCLCQIEDWNPGALWMDRDYIFKAYRQEKTFLHQDYAILVAKIIANGVSCQLHIEENGENGFQRQQSVVEPQEVRQLVSLLMENPELYTPSGLWHVVTTVKDIAQHCHHVSPTIFKPLMLSSMSTMDPVILHLIVYIMLEFENEILTDKEESQMVSCLVRGLDHPSLVPAQRLFFAHWLKILLQDTERDYGVKKYQLNFYPRVFDPVDCQLSKLQLLNACIPPLSELPSDMNGALLLASTGYLHKLVWHTGKQRAVVVLFRALFGMYQKHCSRSFSQDINRFIKGLISGFPHFIPHAIDFLECLKETTSDSTMYLEILTLLHSQVTSTTSEDLAKDYQYYLQVLKKVSLQKEISPQGTIKFMNYLVQNAASIDKSSWVLGNGILAVCHNLLVCHGTQQLYTDIGDILYNMMLTYEDMDIQDRALFYYLLLTSASSQKIQEFLKKTSGAQNISQTLSSLIPEEKSGTRSCSKIIDAECNVLEWKRKSVVAFTEKSQETFDDLETYLEWLSTANTVLKASYQVQLCESSKEKVQAVIVNFSKDNNFETVRAINVAEIRNGEPIGVEFCLKPRYSVPAVFKAWSEFTDNMLTYRNDMENVEISLLDMLLPLPGGVDLYSKLWQSFTDSNNSNRIQCVQSIKVVHKEWQEFTKSMNQSCEKYKVDQDGNKAKYGMLSASGHHLLMSCVGNEEQTNVSIATDSYHMLPFVDKFLSNL